MFLHNLPTPFLKKNTNMLGRESSGGGIHQSPLLKQFNSNYMYQKQPTPLIKNKSNSIKTKLLLGQKKNRTHVNFSKIQGWRRNQCIL